MRKITWFWVIICLLLILIVFISWQQFGKLTPSADILTEREALKLVEGRYQGKVTQISYRNQQYFIALEKQNSLYDIQLDAKSGNIISVVQTDSTPTPTPQQKAELSEDEIKKIVLAEVNGSITSLEKIKNNQEHIYKAVVSDMGKQTTTTLTINAVSGKILSSNSIPIKETTNLITDSEAGQIALKQVQGEIEDIWQETRNNQTYYLVEIETQDDQEAVVQIHSITKEVISITWDDRGKKENDDDD